jgi:hypothetical protein
MRLSSFPLAMFNYISVASIVLLWTRVAADPEARGARLWSLYRRALGGPSARSTPTSSPVGSERHFSGRSSRGPARLQLVERHRWGVRAMYCLLHHCGRWSGAGPSGGFCNRSSEAGLHYIQGMPHGWSGLALTPDDRHAGRCEQW